MWLLSSDRGRQTWHYDDTQAPSAAVEQARAALAEAQAHYTAYREVQRHASDAPLRILAETGLLHDRPPEHADLSGATDDPVGASLRRGIAYYSGLQAEDGHWPGDYGGPLFLMPGLVVAMYVTGTDWPSPHHVAEMKRYLYNQQRSDGGWGLHIEKDSTMFGTVLNYVAMRLLGEDPAVSKGMARAREWIVEHGGAVGIPSWGKFYLALLGLYSWDGINPLTPEMWLLPYALPVHPARMWCHCRMVYLPMSYLYGRRAVVEDNALLASIRKEIHVQPYESIDWPAQRSKVCEVDEYIKRPKAQKLLWAALSVYEKYPLKWLRKRALDETMAQIKAEDLNTKFICIGPVNKVINMLAAYFDDPKGEHLRRHRERVTDYLWLAEDGMKMAGYNGSQLWDTAFTMQAIVATGSIAREFFGPLRRGYHFLDVTQVQEDVPDRDRYYRHISNGAWPFSTNDHGWPISDCSSEGLKAALATTGLLGGDLGQEPISDQRLYNCVNVILSFWNIDSGGWATYELTRGPEWLEYLNPSEVFSSIMIDYTWVECTTACITALKAFQKRFPHHREAEINLVVYKGVECVKRLQRADGSWYGNWGVCFCYAGFFGVEALVSTGHTLDNSENLRKACEFFVSKQRDDGSWGEDYRSSQNQEYVQSDDGQVVHTAWALLSLCLARWPERETLDKAANFLMRVQEDSGDWPQQVITGVFNSNCMISYSNYRSIFPIWALGTYRRLVLGKD